MEVNTQAPVPELKRRALVAGWLYLLVVFTAPMTMIVLPRALVVTNDPVATAVRIRGHEWLARMVVATGVAESLLWVATVVALYRLMRHVDRDRAQTMLLLGMVLPTPIHLAANVLRIAAYTLAHGAPFLAAIPTAQQEALAYLALRVNSQFADIVTVFWGLWLLPLAGLVSRPGLAPRWIAVGLAIAGTGYVVDAFMSMVAPGLERAIAPVFLATAFGELPVVGWLLLWGLRQGGEGARRLHASPAMS
jgi:hypothetical protein